MLFYWFVPLTTTVRVIKGKIAINCFFIVYACLPVVYSFHPNSSSFPCRSRPRGLGGRGRERERWKGGNEKSLGCKRDGVDLHSNNMKSRFNYISAWGIWVWTDWCFKFKNFWELHLFITNYLRTVSVGLRYIYVHKLFSFAPKFKSKQKIISNPEF